MQSQLHPPEILVYDLGNVLVDFDWMIVIKRLAQKTGKTISDFQQLLTNPKLLYDYEAGEITTQEFFNRVQNLIGYPNSLDDFRYDFGDMFTEAIQMTQLQKKIRASGIPTFILSNTNEIAIDFIKDKFPFFGNFDGYVFSYEEKSMKPNVSIYRAIEKISGKSGNQIAFIDDNIENIEGAIQLGWSAQQHVSFESTKDFFRNLGLI